MLKPFDLTSDPLVYAGGIAPVVFRRKPRCRAAIIGVSFNAASPRHAHRNIVTAFQIDGKNYVQGDGVPLGLIAPVPMPLFDDLSAGTPGETLAAMTNTGALTHAVGTADATVEDVGGAFDQTILNNNLKELTTQHALQRALNTALINAVATLAQNAQHPRPYFPGNTLELEDGTKCGAILYTPDSKARMTVQDLTTNAAPILTITLHCVEFPKEGSQGGAAQALFERIHGGDGELVFFGQSHDYSASFSTKFEQTPKPMHGKLLRRLAVRGALYDGSHNITESDFRDLLVELSTASQKHPADAVPAREAIGHAALDWIAPQTDLYADEKALILVTAPTPGAARTLRLCSIFIGRSERAEFQGTANGV